jgi:hypothetical protein
VSYESASVRLFPCNGPFAPLSRRQHRFESVGDARYYNELRDKAEIGVPDVSRLALAGSLRQ